MRKRNVEKEIMENKEIDGLLEKIEELKKKIAAGNKGIDKDINDGLGEVIYEDDNVKAVAVKGNELYAAVAERCGKLTMAIAHAFTAGAKVMACGCFEALGEYIETDDDHGAPMLPKLSSKAAIIGLKIAFDQCGGNFDDFMKYRDQVSKRESKLLRDFHKDDDED